MPNHNDRRSAVEGARHLTPDEISMLIKAHGGPSKVRQIAVENFLMSLPLHLSERDHALNLRMDEQLYGWNAATVAAIKDGIRRIYGGPR